MVASEETPGCDKTLPFTLWGSWISTAKFMTGKSFFSQLLMDWSVDQVKNVDLTFTKVIVRTSGVIYRNVGAVRLWIDSWRRFALLFTVIKNGRAGTGSIFISDCCVTALQQDNKTPHKSSASHLSPPVQNTRSLILLRLHTVTENSVNLSFSWTSEFALLVLENCGLSFGMYLQ